MFTVIFLSLFHCAHRLRHTLMDVGFRHLARILMVVCYGGALAGTIVAGGEPDIRHGAGMKRGTIVFLDPATPPDVLPTFRAAGNCRPTFLRLYLKHLAECGWPVPEGSLEANYRRYNGDFLELGKGELLIRSA